MRNPIKAMHFNGVHLPIGLFHFPPVHWNSSTNCVWLLLCVGRHPIGNWSSDMHKVNWETLFSKSLHGIFALNASILCINAYTANCTTIITRFKLITRARDWIFNKLIERALWTTPDSMWWDGDRCCVGLFLLSNSISCHKLLSSHSRPINSITISVWGVFERINAEIKWRNVSHFKCVRLLHARDLDDLDVTRITNATHEIVSFTAYIKRNTRKQCE